jgi:poly(3-hydroxybutyrate) depolymerase
MTVEGEKDDITGKGQCKAALELCTGVPAARKSHFECPMVGHYGIFTGARFRQEIAPRVSAFLRKHGSRARPQAGVTISAVRTRRARWKWAVSTGTSPKTNTPENAA